MSEKRLQQLHEAARRAEWRGKWFNASCRRILGTIRTELVKYLNATDQDVQFFGPPKDARVSEPRPSIPLKEAWGYNADAKRWMVGLQIIIDKAHHTEHIVEIGMLGDTFEVKVDNGPPLSTDGTARNVQHIVEAIYTSSLSWFSTVFPNGLEVDPNDNY